MTKQLQLIQQRALARGTRAFAICIFIAVVTAGLGGTSRAEDDAPVELPPYAVKGFLAAISSNAQVQANAIFFWNAVGGWKHVSGSERSAVVAALSKVAEASQTPILSASALSGLVQLDERSALTLAWKALESDDTFLRRAAVAALDKWDQQALRKAAFLPQSKILIDDKFRLIGAAAESGTPVDLATVSKALDVSQLRSLIPPERQKLRPHFQKILKAMPAAERLDLLANYQSLGSLTADQFADAVKGIPSTAAMAWVRRELGSGNRTRFYYVVATVATLDLADLAEETEQRLVRLVAETDAPFRRSLIASYGLLLRADTPAAKKLRAALGDPAETLNSLPPTERSLELRRLIASDQDDRDKAFGAIVARADRADLQLLLEFKSPDQEGSELDRPAWVLGPLATSADIPVLRELMFKVRSSAVRSAAVTALGRLKAAEMTNDVIKLLSESDESEVQAAALSALGELGTVKDPAIVLRYLNPGTAPELMRAAIITAGKLKLAAATDPLIKLLQQRSNERVALTISTATISTALASLDIEVQATKIVEAILQGCSCNVRSNASTALPFALRQTSGRELMVARLLRMVQDRDAEIRPPIEAMAHVVGGGEPAPEAMIRWLGTARNTEPLPTNKDAAINALRGIEAAWPTVNKPNDNFRFELARAAQDISTAACTGSTAPSSAPTEFVSRLIEIFGGSGDKQTAACWQGEDASVVRRVHDVLAKAGNDNEAAVLQRHLGTAMWTNWALSVLRWFLSIGGLWVVVWVGLICAYPRSRSIQSQVFWNDTLRKVAGFGLIDFLLRTIGPLRRLILRPFQSRLADAARLDEGFAFFDGIRAEDSQGHDLGRVIDVLPRLQGCLVLVGESGLGKTTLLRWLTRKALDEGRLVAFLDGRRCAEGVYPALTKMVEGIVKEEAFLRTLIHCRDLAVVIDGVNEVSPDTRARIIDFAVSHADADVLLATQPILWDSPLSLPERTLRPLSENDLEAFLLCFQDFLPKGAAVIGADYKKAVQTFVKDMRSQPDPDVRAHDLTIVSNPIDLTLVSELLASGEVPEPSRLDEQIFEKAEKKWNLLNQNAPFPLDDFAEYCFTQRKNDSRRIEDPRFNDLAAVLEQYRILIPRTEKVKDGSGTVDRTYHVFRHERLANFFMFHAFVGPHGHDRRAELISDGRFRSIYLMIADRAALPIAEETLGMLHERALATKDFTVYADYYKRFVARPDVSIVVIGAKAA